NDVYVSLTMSRRIKTKSSPRQETVPSSRNFSRPLPDEMPMAMVATMVRRKMVLTMIANVLIFLPSLLPPRSPVAFFDRMILAECDVSGNMFGHIPAVEAIAACRHRHEEPSEDRDNVRVGGDERQSKNP